MKLPTENFTRLIDVKTVLWSRVEGKKVEFENVVAKSSQSMFAQRLFLFVSWISISMSILHFTPLSRIFL